MDKTQHSSMIHVCFCIDSKFIIPCKILLKSILKNTKSDCTFHFIGISETDMEVKNKCKFYPNPDLSYFTQQNLTNYHHFSKAAMYRLLIPFLIKTDKALYLDADTLVVKDIKALWEQDTDLVGAVIDAQNICNLSILKTLNKSPIYNDKYYNSGVILFNSEKIRKEYPNYKQKILDIQNNYQLYYKDQDIFNIIFENRITTLDYKYNVNIYNIKEKNEPKCISKFKNKAYKAPAIIHCMGPKKWWETSSLPFYQEWEKYKNIFSNFLN